MKNCSRFSWECINLRLNTLLCILIFSLSHSSSVLAQNSIGFGEAIVISDQLTLPIELTNTSDLSFFLLSVSFDHEILAIGEEAVKENIDRVDDVDVIEKSIDSEVGIISISVANFSSGVVIGNGSGEVFGLTFTLKSTNICPGPLITISNVEGVDILFDPVTFETQSPEDREFSISPSRGCLRLERTLYSCNDTIGIILHDQNLASVKLLDFDFEDGDGTMNSGTLGQDYNINLSSSDVVANKGADSDHSLFFNDANDMASSDKPFSFPGESGRFELQYQITQEAIGRDNVLFTTLNANGDAIRHKLWVRDNGSDLPEIIFQEADNVQILSGEFDLTTDELWHHLEFVWAPGICRILIDGKIITGSAECTFMRFPDVSGFAIGGEILGAQDNNFRGYLDNVRLYQKGPTCVRLETSGSATDTESFCLFETIPGSGEFMGSIGTSNENEVIEEDRVLTVADEDIISITYEDVEDESGLTAEVIEIVTIDCTAPVISVAPDIVDFSAGSTLPDFLEGVTATDGGADITHRIVLDDSEFRPEIPGEYTIRYLVVDEAGNIAAEATRIVRVIDDSIQIILTPIEDTAVIPEGETLPITVALNKAPTDDVVLSLFRIHGDQDLNFQEESGELMFNIENWDIGEIATLFAEEDDDQVGTSATFLIRKKSGNDKVLNKTFSAVEADDDFIVTLDSSGPGTTDPSGAVIVDDDDEFPILAIPEPNNEFVKWEFRGNLDIADPTQAATTLRSSEDALVIALFKTQDPSPTVEIVNPQTNAAFILPATVDIEIQATDNGSIAKVELFIDDQKIDEKEDPPFQFQLNIAIPGSYILTAIATDNERNKTVSDPVIIEVKDLSFTFEEPSEGTPDISRLSIFNFGWSIPDDAQEFEFDLYLARSNNININQLNSAFKLNEFPLNTNDNREAYEYTNGFPIDPNSNITVWYPFVLILNAPYQGQIFVSQNALNINNREDVQIDILRPREGIPFDLGQFIPLKASFVSRNGIPLTGAVTLNLIKDNVPENPFNEYVSNGLLEFDLMRHDLPASPGNWEIEIVWRQSSLFNETQKESSFTVEKTRAFIGFSPLGAIHPTGEPLKIGGELRLFNQNPGALPLDNYQVQLIIKDPLSIPILDKELLDLDDEGHFVYEFENGFFDTQGTWEFTVECPNDDFFSECESFKDTLQVKDRRGYAILLLGSEEPVGINEPEGIQEHRRTLEFIQDKMLEAEFESGDIQWLDGSDESFSIEGSLRPTIETWAKDKLLGSPAPLYIFLVGHGNPNEFQLNNETLTATQLNEMITNLEEAIPEGNLAQEENIVLLTGMCYSGSFIKSLSKEGRVIITASAPNERSIRGLGESDDRYGEYFLYLLFREFSQGSSLAKSFEISSKLIRVLTGGFDLARQDLPLFLNELGQHPLLDDNGDGIGNTRFATGIEDGNTARRIFLVDEAPSRLNIERVNPTRFLPHTDGDPELWAELEKDDAFPNPTVFMEVKPPKHDTSLEGSSTMQAGLTLSQVEMERDSSVTEKIRFRWPPKTEDNSPSDLFSSPGEYQIFFFALSEDGNSQSEPEFVRVYKANESTDPNLEVPSPFNLLSPSNGAVINFSDEENAGFFTWESNGCGESFPECEVQYFFRLWSNSFSDSDESLIFETGPTNVPFAFFTASRLPTGDFWWDVVAVTKSGAFAESNQRFLVTLLPTNGINFGFLFGRLSERKNDREILNATLQIQGLSNRNHFVDAGIYALTLQAAKGYNILAKAAGYEDSEASNIEIRPNEERELNLTLPIGMFLEDGWNLVSTPVVLDQSETKEYFRNSNENRMFQEGPVWKWEQGQFQLATEFVPGKGYWVKGLESAFFETSGLVSDSFADKLNPGWNLIGIKGLNALNQLNDISPTNILWGWDNILQRYILVNPDDRENSNNLIPGRGYWVYKKRQ